MQRKSLYLVDGNSYGYRAYYAITHLSTSQGRPTGAVYGFVTMLNKLRSDVKPDYLAVCFDLKGPTLRHEKFADYKIHRKPMPDDLQAQMPVIKEVITAYGIPIFQLAGYEADDILASLAKKLKSEVDVYIASADKDMLQMVDKYVKIYNPQKDISIIDEKSVIERYKVAPSHITDLLALTGDSSDNIPGVPGIGWKTAAELINAFGGLEGILSNTDKIAQKKRRELLEEFSEQARLSKELATLCTDVPINITIERLKESSPDTETLRRIFRELEFKNLFRQIPAKEADSSAIKVHSVDTRDKLKQLCDNLARESCVSFVLRTLDDKKSLVGIDLSSRKDCLFKIETGSGISMPDIKEYLGPVFANKRILKISYDIKYACVLLDRCGVSLEEPFFDIMVAAYLLTPGAGTRTLTDIAGEYNESTVNASLAACEQLRIKEVVELELEDKNLRELFSRVEMPLVKTLASMESAGIKVDKGLLLRLGQEMEAKLRGVTQAIYENSGCEFNINSPKQLSDILFNRLNLPVIKKGKSGPSTDVDVLRRLASEHTLPALILEYRELAKLQSTYVMGMLELIDENTGRVHTSFNQTVTATGRLSSSVPNLQNIPVRSEAGRQIRAAFIAGTPESWLVSADYSQIELRVLAHLSKDDQLINAFRQGLDVHAFTAALVFGIEQEDVTEKMRDTAKRVNFGIIYGMGAHGLARDIGVSFAEAKKFIEDYFKRYPAVKRYMEQQIAFARENGYVTTLFNRRRYIPQINSKDAMQRSFAERTAMNTPIQGTAADLIKVAMAEIDAVLRQEKYQTRMVLQVHDELVFDVPDAELARVKRMVKDRMEHAVALDVPVEVGLKTGVNWKDMN
ncbi:MAG: DNA polymerase I [Candidatus Omnitrophica bacterium]|nr:DNA polymerase I [Candidatus Omnitrophota bacterium]MBU4479355.1 DNA polymerase I [Candidatus Omnitrophota bacterium]MCG2703831.1 DNA polymerase I [Candidatus Omnitrophota bacterium]